MDTLVTDGINPIMEGGDVLGGRRLIQENHSGGDASWVGDVGDDRMDSGITQTSTW